MREREQGSEEQGREGAHASPPPAPSRQGDGEEAGTAPAGRPREGQGSSQGVRYEEDRTAGYGAAGSADGERARAEPESQVNKINHGDKLDGIVPRRERDS